MFGEVFYILIFIIVFVVALFIILFFIRKANLDVERRLTDLIVDQLKEIRGSTDNSAKDINNQMNSFIRETADIRQKMSTMQETVKGISSFQEVFRSPKIRGEWGEASLKHLLKEYFPDALYTFQYPFSSGEKVDAILKLPDEKILPIDAKFPLDNFRKMAESDGEERDEYRKKFLDDAKKHIQKIAEKYILPSENTVDFAVMYIPAEAVYYEINMAHNIDISEYARSKKVILSSPNTFYLTLRAIEQWFRDTAISKQAHEILQRLTRIEKDGTKLSDDFRKLGLHLKNAVSSYKSSKKRVTLFDKRVKGILKSKKITDLKKIEK